MRNPPKVVKIGGNAIKVRKSNKLGNLYGITHTREGWLEYAHDLSPTVERSTVLHECIHQVIDLYYLNPNVKKGQLEQLVLGLEIGLFALIRDNPDLIKYLTAKG